MGARRVPDPELALAYGLAVFPLLPGTKTVTGPGWQTTALLDVDEIRRTWRPGTNIGVGCWKSDVVVLDLDVPGAGHRTPVAGEDTLSTLCNHHDQPWPPTTLTVATAGGGRHLYYRRPRGRMIGSSIGSTSSGLGPGIDVRGPGRGLGGYLVGPDSIVSARRYRIQVDAPIAELPSWLADLLDMTRVQRSDSSAAQSP